MAISAEPGTQPLGDAAYFARLTTSLAALIVFAFALHAMLGRAAYTYTLIWPHVHGVVMVSWLALNVTQARHAASGRLVQHRKLGWIGAFLAAAVVGTMCYAGVTALRQDLVPPFFTPAYFLALTQVGGVVFGGLVFAAITRRTQTDHHRRLMTGSLIMLLEPALGRLLPMPLMVGWSEWAIMVLQLAIVGLIALHDKRTLGRVHQATMTVGAIIAMTHVLIEIAAVSPAIQRLADNIAGG